MSITWFSWRRGAIVVGHCHPPHGEKWWMIGDLLEERAHAKVRLLARCRRGRGGGLLLRCQSRSRQVPRHQGKR
ncbi:hypothetical protein MICRO8M_130066 [Microbacterium sp. 8M]|nr:hypothetical protein MICRO8M_130066 [Microbacterium sp. 8M]